MGVPGSFSISALLGVSLTLAALLIPLVPRWIAGEPLRRPPGAPGPSGPGDGCPTCPDLADDENVTLIQLLQGNLTGRVCLKNVWQLKPSGLFRELLVRAAYIPDWWLESPVLVAWAVIAVWAYGYCGQRHARPTRSGRRLDIGAAVPAGFEADRTVSR